MIGLTVLRDRDEGRRFDSAVERRLAHGDPAGCRGRPRGRARRTVTGEVRFDAGSRALYATDGSNYRQCPSASSYPGSKEDVIATVSAAENSCAPVLPRGGGTSLAGQCCNVAVVMDFSKYLHHVLRLDRHRSWRRSSRAVCSTACAPPPTRRAEFGPDPSTHNHCNLGGMLGNDPAAPIR